MKNSGAYRILIIEDESHIAEGLKLNLMFQGYEVCIAPDGSAGLREWNQWRPDLIVLDIMLPVIDGFSVLKSIRLEDERVPILILSAKGDMDHKIRGLADGVDDYMVKPFNLEEFLLRIERLLKHLEWSRQQQRGNTDPEKRFFSFGNNRIDFDTGITNCSQGEVQLTEQEIKLMKLFIANRDKPLSRKKILEIGWGYSAHAGTRTVDNFIVRFRKYFEDDPKKPVFFKSVRAVGYVFHDKT